MKTKTELYKPKKLNYHVKNKYKIFINKHWFENKVAILFLERHSIFKSMSLKIPEML